MYPEAGGSSSFARHAFNEFWSFFAAWGQMLNYTITIAISAFFVPHYIGGLFWAPLRHSPGDIIFGIGVVAVLSAINVVGVKESAGVNVAARGRRLLHPAAAGRRRRGPRALARDAGRQRPPGRRADVEGLPHRDPGGDDRLHRHRDDLEHGRGGQGRGEDDPGGDQPRRDRRVRDLRRAARRRAVRAAGHAERRRQLPDAARPDRGAGRLRRRPDPRRRQDARPRVPPAAGGDLRRPARRDDPLHRDERRDHRRLAARLLDGPAPPGARPAAPAAPEVRHAVDRDPRVRRRSPASR